MSFTFTVWKPLWDAGMPFTAAMIPLIPAVVLFLFVLYVYERKKVQR